MKPLAYDLLQLCRRNRDGSFATQKKREQVLQLVARQLDVDLQFTHMRARSLKPKHVSALVGHWQRQSLSVQTIKSRLTYLRWWAQKVGKANVIARSNDDIGVGRREFTHKASRAYALNDEMLNAVPCDFVKASLWLAREFGLRKEEAIKIIPNTADGDTTLFLESSWCKGGRAREIPIRTEAQRHALEFAKGVAGGGSLIPEGSRFVTQRRAYDGITHTLGLRKLHGLRHAYAQARYRELTGWDCPNQGGPSRQAMSGNQKSKDRMARLRISQELGHNRAQIVATYIG